jgi:hypothetical protein
LQGKQLSWAALTFPKLQNRNLVNFKRRKLKMLRILSDYLQNLTSEIDSYKRLLVQKRGEMERLTQLQGQVMEALGLLKTVVDELQDKEPNAIAVIREAAQELFTRHSQETPVETPETESIRTEEIETETEVAETESNDADSTDDAIEDPVNLMRLSESIFYDSDSNAEKAEAVTTDIEEEAENTADTVAEPSEPDTTASEQVTQVKIHSQRFPDLNGTTGDIISWSQFGAKVKLPSEKEIFFLKDEIEEVTEKIEEAPVDIF